MPVGASRQKRNAANVKAWKEFKGLLSSFESTDVTRDVKMSLQAGSGGYNDTEVLFSVCMDTVPKVQNIKKTLGFRVCVRTDVVSPG